MTIEERLENMERELGRVKEVLARSQVEGTAKEIRANSFVLEDENGKPRVGLGALKKVIIPSPVCRMRYARYNAS